MSPGLPQRPASAGENDTKAMPTLMWIHLEADKVFSVLKVVFFKQTPKMHLDESVVFMW